MSNVRPSAGRSPIQLKRHLPMPAFQGLGLDAFCYRERRARLSVCLGCPSSGGQRTGSSCSSRVLAGVVTSRAPLSPATRAMASPLAARGIGSSLAIGLAAPHLFYGKLAAPSHASPAEFTRYGPTETAAAPVRQSRAPVIRRAASRLSRPSAWGWRAAVGASPAPNHSVKGTSCGKPQAAPYLER